jgi:DNA polymerase/3'-5' exonuclease PolX
MSGAGDKKTQILEILTVLRQKATAEGDKYRAIAFSKAIKAIEKIPAVQSIADITGVPGVGSGVKDRVAELLETGHLLEAEAAKEEYSLEAYNVLQEVQGIGPVKARDLITKHGIKTIDQLREATLKNPDLLTHAQMVGLVYLDSLKERIPRAEMKKHEAYVRRQLPKEFEMVVVGSYRRGLPTSGDFDVMITSQTLAESDANTKFQQFIDLLTDKNYLQEEFARGEHKFMGVCKLRGPEYKDKYRHVDLLLCKPEEYWYTILYFTGSDVFNVSMRRYALTKGYSLSEHGLKRVREGVPVPPAMNSEKDIFDFLGLEYVRPEDRINPLT